MRLQGILDVLVQLLIRSSGFGSVKIAASDDLTVRGLKVQSAGNVVEVAQRHELHDGGLGGSADS